MSIIIAYLERRIEVMLLMFVDIRDVPFHIYSCESCSSKITERLTLKQKKLQEWIEDDHATKMKEAMEKVGITNHSTTTTTTTTNDNANNKRCNVM